jgi:hypothetical protein
MDNYKEWITNFFDMLTDCNIVLYTDEKSMKYIPITEKDLELKIPKINELKSLLMTTYGFSEDNIENMIGFLRKKYNIHDNEYLKKRSMKLQKESIDIFADSDEEDKQSKKKINKVSKKK